MATITTLTPKSSADSEYSTGYMELLQNMDRLKARIEQHSVDQSKDKKNWGFVGDLAMMNKAVLEALGEGK